MIVKLVRITYFIVPIHIIFSILVVFLVDYIGYDGFWPIL